MSQMAEHSINQPSGRAVTRSFNLPWSSGDDFRLSLKPISAGDRGSIPRGRVSFFNLQFLFAPTVLTDYRGMSGLVLFIDREESCIV